MNTLFALTALAGMWIWVVKNRGDWHLFLANLAGAGAGLVAIVVESILLAGFFDSELPKGLALSLFAVLTSAGAFAGVWMWIARRPQPEHPVARHLLGAICGFASGVTTLVFISLNF